MGSALVKAKNMETDNPMSILLVVVSAGILAAVGGFAESLRRKDVGWQALAASSLNMGCLGVCVSLCGVWYFDDMENKETCYLFIIGLSGLCGLVGYPILEPVSKFVVQQIERILGLKK